MPDVVKFGDYIRRIRKAENLSIRAAEQRSGVSNSYISQIERGERGVPTTEILKKLAKAYNWPYGDLLDRAGHLDGMSEEKKEAIKRRHNISSALDDEISEILDQMVDENGILHEEFFNSLTEIVDGYLEPIDDSDYYISFKSKHDLKRLKKMISHYDSTEGKQDILIELKNLLENYNSNLGIETIVKRPNITYKGQKIDSADRDRILAMLDVLFSDRQ